ncbi:MAG TPA: hypothetical protein VGI32_10695 [Steroidobacteraceae bacterium]|jgi:hypothetical protein
MKISSDPGIASALDTWLRAEEPSLQSPAAPVHAAASVNAAIPARYGAAPARDSAEALLALDVWNGSGPSRELASLSAAPRPPDAEPPSSVQGWTDYIFQPLH